MSEAGKINFDALLAEQTSFPLTMEELHKYMTNVTRDVENLNFIHDFVQHADNSWSTNKLIKSSATLMTEPSGYDAIRSKGGDSFIKSRTSTIETTAENLTAVIREGNQRLIDTYIRQGTPQELNINDTTRKVLLAASLDSPPMQLFAQCVKEVKQNIDQNAVPRFLKHAQNHNLGTSEALVRLYWCIFLTVCYSTMNILLMVYRQSNFARLASLPLAFLMNTTFWQWRQKFCVVLGKQRLAHYSEDNDAEHQQVVEACVLVSHAKRQRQIYFKSYIGTFLLITLVMVLPPYSLL